MPRASREYGGCSRDHAFAAPALGEPLALDDRGRLEGGGADVADLALVDQVGERAEGLVEVGVRLGAVHLVEVDPVGAEPAQAVLDLADDPTAAVAPLVGVVAEAAVELGGQHDVVAPAAGEGLADDGLRLARGVDVGGVDEVDARVQRVVDDPDAVVVVGVAAGAEHHGAEGQRADLHAGTPEGAVFRHPAFTPTSPARPMPVWPASLSTVSNSRLAGRGRP